MGVTESGKLNNFNMVRGEMEISIITVTQLFKSTSSYRKDEVEVIEIRKEVNDFFDVYFFLYLFKFNHKWQ